MVVEKVVGQFDVGRISRGPTIRLDFIVAETAISQIETPHRCIGRTGRRPIKFPAPLRIPRNGAGGAGGNAITALGMQLHHFSEEENRNREEICCGTKYMPIDSNGHRDFFLPQKVSEDFHAQQLENRFVRHG